MGQVRVARSCRTGFSDRGACRHKRQDGFGKVHCPSGQSLGLKEELQEMKLKRQTTASSHKDLHFKSLDFKFYINVKVWLEG